MMNDSRCTDLQRSRVERYVAGRLDGSEIEQFESHLVGCRDCQQSVRLGAAIREELPALQSSIRADRRRATRPALILATGVAAAAIAIVAGMQQMDRRALRDLGGVATPPPYQGIAVRSSVSPADSLFVDGMRLYQLRRVDAAHASLIEARARGMDSVPTSFFIGVMDLMSGRPRDAMNEMAIVLRRGDTPYAAEAHYYMAKAWLLLGDPDSAQTHLAVAARANATISSAAEALADSVRKVRR